PRMQVKAVGGPLLSHMQSCTGHRDLDAAPGQTQGLRRLGRSRGRLGYSRWRWLLEVRQERRDIPLSVVTAPQADAEIFHAQHDRVRGHEEPDRREVERETLHA